MKIRVYDQGEILQMYLDWFNNFLTVPRFAEYYNISEKFAEEVISIGRETLNRQLYETQRIEVRR